MGDELPQSRLIEGVRERCRSDERVRAALQYGSFGRGEGDRHSDVEFYLFVEDDELGAFDQQAWVAAVAPPLAFFVNEFGTRVAIFDDLVRGEFHFEPASATSQVRAWISLERPGTPERMLIVDREGTLTEILDGLQRGVPSPLLAQELHDRLLNWLLLGCHVLQRGERARALDALTHVHRFLLMLARLAERNLDHWLTPSRNVERELSQESLARFVACTADLTPGALEAAYRNAWAWARDLAAALAKSHPLDARDAVAREVEKRLDAWLPEK